MDSVSNWGDKVLSRFDQSAQNYNASATLQHAVAVQLANHCRQQHMPGGLWVDLGSGTGHLADALETRHPGQRVLRVDGSEAMLRQQPLSARTQQWDLRGRLPRWPEAPSLLASSFCLHWLPSPGQVIRHWLNQLAPGGWLAVALPIEGCFPQWHHAAEITGIPCTAITFPKIKALLQWVGADQIRLQEEMHYNAVAKSLPRLLKPLRRVGADCTTQPSLTVRDWRKLQQAWPDLDGDGQLRLTWVIKLMLIQR
ncbi:methyltransferase [Synechococcus sp. UW179A]|uniref:methyltransferase n=1 Tax=Synechococcus sp. UW179A TaxID=2575510 RepID=UPI000E0E5E2E|nr:methyltransferase [Synechococcus sp. UW179A]